MICIFRRYPRINHINRRETHLVKLCRRQRSCRIEFGWNDFYIFLQNIVIKVQCVDVENFICTCRRNFNSYSVRYKLSIIWINSVLHGERNNLPSQAQKNFIFVRRNKIVIFVRNFSSGRCLAHRQNFCLDFVPVCSVLRQMIAWISVAFKQKIFFAVGKKEVRGGQKNCQDNRQNNSNHLRHLLKKFLQINFIISYMRIVN